MQIHEPPGLGQFDFAGLYFIQQRQQRLLSLSGVKAVQLLFEFLNQRRCLLSSASVVARGSM
jgi:hypothetical protein